LKYVLFDVASVNFQSYSFLFLFIEVELAVVRLSQKIFPS